MTLKVNNIFLVNFLLIFLAFLIIAKNGEIRKSSMSNVNTNEKYRFWAFFLKHYVL